MLWPLQAQAPSLSKYSSCQRYSSSSGMPTCTASACLCGPSPTPSCPSSTSLLTRTYNSGSLCLYCSLFPGWLASHTRTSSFFTWYALDTDFPMPPFYSVSMLLVKENAPSPYALGQSNGLVMFAMCVSRACAPAFVRYVRTATRGCTSDYWRSSSSMFVLSIKHNVLGGYMWTVVMVAISLLGCTLSRSISHPEGRIQLR